jgi:translation initiation factor IF-3
VERARQLAVERELDLVEVAPMAQPPVCRLMDYGRFKFDTLKREKDSRKEHNLVRLKEMKLRPKISDHDFRTKFGYVKHFLQDGDKVKLTIMFRGREMVHQEFGRKLLDRMAAELKDIAIIERNPLVEGRNMIMILSPLAKKQAKGPHLEGAEPARTPGDRQDGEAAPSFAGGTADADGGDRAETPQATTAAPTIAASTATATATATATVPVATESAVEATSTQPTAQPAAAPPATAPNPESEPNATDTKDPGPAAAGARRPAAGGARRTRGSTADAQDQNP